MVHVAIVNVRLQNGTKEMCMCNVYLNVYLEEKSQQNNNAFQ